MAGPPPREFGRRPPDRLPDRTPPKRSNHVALLVMGTLAIGGGAYALMPSESCQPPAPGTAPPGMAQPATSTTCTTRSSSGGSGGGYSRSSHWSFFGGSSSSGSASAGTAESSSHVTRGGFGSFGRAFGFSGG